jgi:hypothetical protein
MSLFVEPAAKGSLTIAIVRAPVPASRACLRVTRKLRAVGIITA